MGRHAPGRCLEKRIAFRDGQIWGGTAWARADGSWWLTDGDILWVIWLVLFPLFRKSKFIVIKCPFIAHPYRKLQYDIAGWYMYIHFCTCFWKHAIDTRFGNAKVHGSQDLIKNEQEMLLSSLGSFERFLTIWVWRVQHGWAFFLAIRTGSLSGRRMCHT